MSNEALQLVVGKSDAETAREREAIEVHLVEVCRIMDRARAYGMQINFSVQPDGFGRHQAPVTIVKQL